MPGSTASWSSPDRHHQPPTPAPVPVPRGLTTPATPQDSYYYYTQSQAAASPPPIASYDPNTVLDLSIDPANYIAYPAGFYSQDQYSAQQRLPTQSQQQQQFSQDVQPYPRGQHPPQPSFRGPPTNPAVLTRRQAAQQLQLEQQQQQHLQQQSSPSTPGMYTSSSASSPSPSAAAFEGNILFWTSESLPMFSFTIHFLSLRALSHDFSLPLVQLHMHGEILAQNYYRANVNAPNMVSSSQPPVYESHVV